MNIRYRLLTAALATLLTATPALAIPPDYQVPENPRAPESSGALSDLECVDGEAGEYHCDNIDLLAYVPLADMGCASSGNDIWGWTDPVTGAEYALMGCNNGTSFVDVSDPVNPVHVGFLPTHTSNSDWRDIKVYADHAFVVCDIQCAGHGLQVFDLTQLRDVTDPPVVFENSAHLASFDRAHNIVINEDTGFAYVVGSNNQCSGGLYIVDINDPTDPQEAGCFSADGYTHDAQCVTYQGPDEDHQGSETCFNSNEDTLTIVDVSDKSDPVQLSREGYDDVGYTHQGWLTEDHHYFLLDDETDEINFGHNTRTRIWDVSDLEIPEMIGIFESTEDASDHNLYIKGDYVYQSNYRAGLRILDLENVADGELTEVAWFNVIPHDHGARHDELGGAFEGTWSNYPYFDSGIVIVSAIGFETPGGGLYVLQPNLLGTAPPGVLEIAPQSHDFGEVETGDVSAPLEIVVSNTAEGDAEALTLDGITITGAGFEENAGTCAIDTSLEVKQSCALEVTFQPDAAGPFQGTLTVSSDDGQQVESGFSGIGVEPPPGILVVEPTALDFGEVPEGNTAVAAIMVSNAAEKGASTILPSEILIVGMPAFTDTGTGSCEVDVTELEPGDACTVKIAFTPDAAADFAAALIIETTDDQSANLDLSGSGVIEVLIPEIFDDRFEVE